MKCPRVYMILKVVLGHSCRDAKNKILVGMRNEKMQTQEPRDPFSPPSENDPALIWLVQLTNKALA